MGAFIIYATILVNGTIGVIEYKQTMFKTDVQCVQFLEQNNAHINGTLKEHLKKREPNSTVLFIGCSERNKITNETDI
tara:strand:- start:7775 stop:8008 length:234 start_codon:yes stop_codon:yes gene_type:complete